MASPDTAYACPELEQDAKYEVKIVASKIAKTLAVYDRSDPRAA